MSSESSDMAGVADSIDWKPLRDLAMEMTSRSWAPYSGLHVGAAGLRQDGTIVSGCNVENASYGLTLCAECGLVSDFYRSGGGALVAISVAGGDGQKLLPCGRCRQLLYEVGGPKLVVDADPEPVSLEALLPRAFRAEDLPSAQRHGKEEV